MKNEWKMEKYVNMDGWKYDRWMYEPTVYAVFSVAAGSPPIIVIAVMFWGYILYYYCNIVILIAYLCAKIPDFILFLPLTSTIYIFIYWYCYKSLHFFAIQYPFSIFKFEPWCVYYWNAEFIGR